MPQDALRFAPRSEGGAIVMSHADDMLTRTYGAKGLATKLAESGLPFRTVLARDIMDMRRMGSCSTVIQAISNKVSREFWPTTEKLAILIRDDYMEIRQAVKDLIEPGAFPSEAEVTLEQLTELQRLLERVAAPVSDEEAQALLAVFGPDGCFGMAWTVLHLIESAPRALTADIHGMPGMNG